MTKLNDELLTFENKKVRRVELNGEWFFSVVDVVAILVETTAKDKGAYWRKLKERLNSEGGNEAVTNCHELKLIAEDGKMRATDCANLETIFRIIQSIPSPKAEPIKQWLAKVGYERIQEVEDPELVEQRAVEYYKQKGYDENWIKVRIQTIFDRKNLTDEWKNRGALDKDYEIFTAIMSKATFGLKPSEHKQIKELKRENLRDHMTPVELALTNLGEVTARELHKSKNTQGREELKKDVKIAGNIAGKARKNIELETRKPVVSKNNYLELEKIKKIK